MTQPLIVSQLRAKQAEIEAQIGDLNRRLADAKADLFHLAATVKLFDPTAAEKPATVYHAATKTLKRADLFELCKAALEASPEPLDTRQLARYVIDSQAWDVEDRRLRLTMAHKVGLMMSRFEQRGLVRGVGSRGRATVWGLA